MGFSFGGLVSIASGVIGGAGAILGGVAQKQAGEMDAKGYKELRKQQLENANLIEEETRQQIAARQRILDRTIATQRATGGASGYAIDTSGSFGSIQDDSRSEFKFDKANIELTGKIAANRERIGAQQSGLAARAAQQSGKYGFLGGLLGGARSLLDGYLSFRNTN